MAQQPMPKPLGDIRSEMLVQMNHAYPQKTTYVGETALNALIDQGITSAKGYGFEADRELALVVVLMFAFGHGCLDDPLYPWIANTVTKETIIDPSDRAARLEKKAMIWLDHVLSYFY